MSLQLTIRDWSGESYRKEIRYSKDIEKITIYDYIFIKLDLLNELCDSAKHSDFVLSRQSNVEWTTYLGDLIKDNLRFIDIRLTASFKVSNVNHDDSQIPENETRRISNLRLNSGGQTESKPEDEFVDIREDRNSNAHSNPLLLSVNYTLTSDDPSQRSRDEKELPNFIRCREEFNKKLLEDVHDPTKAKRMIDGTTYPTYPNEGAFMNKYRDSTNGFDLDIPEEFIREIENEQGFFKNVCRKTPQSILLAHYQQYVRENENRQHDGKYLIWKFDSKAVCISPLYGTAPRHFKIRYREVPNGEKFFYCTREGNRYPSLKSTIDAYVMNRIRLYLKTQRGSSSSADKYPLFLKEPICLERRIDGIIIPEQKPQREEDEPSPLKKFDAT
ncbi:DgyrCDS10622 [Dimorphilus gyrociliatus]|uniref:DgyrCDS10622 n=1 Tax=Dimorphilus gyrociliatus TaxID=2664684 RepID=A0A7I8W266_9ANNE|nr:DgyrCDS10622 [Dimorphilus gyrociliatus]